MEYPYTVCHILSSLTGSISGPFMGTEAAMPAVRQYGELRAQMKADAWLYGTTTMKEFTGFCKPEPELLNTEDGEPEDDYQAPHEENFYYASLDVLGEIGWESGTFINKGRAPAHVIETLTGQTPAGYRAYLKKKGVSYITAGEKELDCRLALKKLYQMFGIRKLLICGGGMADWSFLEQGTVDELSLVLAPAADGKRSAVVFEAFRENDGGKAVQFRLKEAKVLEENTVHLIYEPIR